MDCEKKNQLKDIFLMNFYLLFPNIYFIFGRNEK